MSAPSEPRDRPCPPDHGNPRTALPNRRTGGTLDFRWGGLAATFTVGWSCYPGSWRLAEVFLNVAPTQGNLEKECRDAGILASFALQHGASLDALVDGVTHEEDGAASSIIGTALGLVRAAIARLAGDAGPIETPAPGGGPSDAGQGGEVAVAGGLAQAEPAP